MWQLAIRATVVWICIGGSVFAYTPPTQQQLLDDVSARLGYLPFPHPCSEVESDALIDCAVDYVARLDTWLTAYDSAAGSALIELQKVEKGEALYSQRDAYLSIRANLETHKNGLLASLYPVLAERDNKERYLQRNKKVSQAFKSVHVPFSLDVMRNAQNLTPAMRECFQEQQWEAVKAEPVSQMRQSADRLYKSQRSCIDKQVQRIESSSNAIFDDYDGFSPLGEDNKTWLERFLGRQRDMAMNLDNVMQMSGRLVYRIAEEHEAQQLKAREEREQAAELARKRREREAELATIERQAKSVINDFFEANGKSQCGEPPQLPAYEDSNRTVAWFNDTAKGWFDCENDYRNRLVSRWNVGIKAAIEKLLRNRPQNALPADSVGSLHKNGTARVQRLIDGSANRTDLYSGRIDRRNRKLEKLWASESRQRNYENLLRGMDDYLQNMRRSRTQLPTIEQDIYITPGYR